MPIFNKHDKNGNLSINVAEFNENLSTLGNPIRLVMDDSNERIAIEQRLLKKPPVYIAYSQIAAVETMSSTEIAEKGKNVLGRAAVGGVFLGPLGALIGGMSGIGNKKLSVTKNFLVINYHSSQIPEEIKAISFEIVGATLHLFEFIKVLKGKIPQTEQLQSSYL